jgi:hypothetical protein
MCDMRTEFGRAKEKLLAPFDADANNYFQCEMLGPTDCCIVLDQ